MGLFRTLLPLGAVMLTVLGSEPARAAATYDDPAPYCAAVGTIDKPDRRYAGEPVPDWIARALMRATDAPPTAELSFFKHAAWRCERGRVLACSYGANIPCNRKADPRRRPGAGERGFCRDHPGADLIPAVATGHATVFEWRCRGTRPVIARQVLEIDRRGFPAAFWHVVTPTGSRRR